jgi:hypothetical protein
MAKTAKEVSPTTKVIFSETYEDDIRQEFNIGDAVFCTSTKHYAYIVGILDTVERDSVHQNGPKHVIYVLQSVPSNATYPVVKSEIILSSEKHIKINNLESEELNKEMRRNCYTHHINTGSCSSLIKAAT